MPGLPHLPALRRGKPYASLEQVTVNDCRTGEALARLSQVNAGVIRKDLSRISDARSALKRFRVVGCWTSAARPPGCS